MVYRVGPIKIDSERLAVLHGRRALPVAPKVAETLAILCEHRGDFVSKEELMERLWPGLAADDTVLWQNVSLVRKLLRPYVGADAVETLPRRGYRLRPEIPGEVRANRWSIAASAAAAIALVIALAGSSVLSESRHGEPLSGEALRTYNLGMHYVAVRKPQDVLRAMDAFGGTIRLAPSSPLGYAGYADALDVDAAYSTAASAPLLTRAYGYANAALVRDPQSPQALTAMAHTEYALAAHGPHSIPHDAYVKRARMHFVQALALDDAYAPAHLWYGQLLVDEGQITEGYRELSHAVDLDPALGIANASLSVAEYLLGHTDAATRHAADALDFGAWDRQVALEILAAGFMRQHRYAQALVAARLLSRYEPSLALTERAYIEAKLHHIDLARTHLAQALRLGPCPCIEYWLNVALVHIALGENRAALKAIAAAPKNPLARALLSYDPRFQAWRRTQRFAAAL